MGSSVIDAWIFCAVAAGALVVTFVGAWCWPFRISKGRSVDEVRQHIEDEEARDYASAPR